MIRRTNLQPRQYLNWDSGSSLKLKLTRKISVRKPSKSSVYNGTIRRNLDYRRTLANDRKAADLFGYASRRPTIPEADYSDEVGDSPRRLLPKLSKSITSLEINTHQHTDSRRESTGGKFRKLSLLSNASRKCYEKSNLKSALKLSKSEPRLTDARFSVRWSSDSDDSSLLKYEGFESADSRTDTDSGIDSLILKHYRTDNSPKLKRKNTISRQYSRVRKYSFRKSFNQGKDCIPNRKEPAKYYHLIPRVKIKKVSSLLEVNFMFPN